MVMIGIGLITTLGILMITNPEKHEPTTRELAEQMTQTRDAYLRGEITMQEVEIQKAIMREKLGAKNGTEN